MEIKKPNDMFAVIMQTPDANVIDLLKSNIDLKNTQLLDKDLYKELPKIQETFKDDNGNFNDDMFNAAYGRAASLVNELGNDDFLSKAIEYDPYDFTAPIGGKDINTSAVVFKDINPFKNEYSRTAINSIDANNFSYRELAQNGNIFDIKSGKWLDKTANDLGFFGSIFNQTLVYAQWDEDGEEINPESKLKSKHKKGDWKFDKNGDLYVETLGDREVYNKQIVNPMDLITIDGSSLNKIDFFDADGKNKSVIGTTAKVAAEIAPLLIPGLNVYYGGFKMGLGLMTVLPTFYKAIEGVLLGDTKDGIETPLWEALNKQQGFLSKYSTNSISDESQSSMFNYEQMTEMISQIFGQIYEQRAAASLSKLFYKTNNKKYLETLSEKTAEPLANAIKAGNITGENVESISGAAMKKAAELSGASEKRSKLAKGLSLGYMALTQSSDVYGDAIAGGYDRRSAGIAALLAAGGQYALMSNNRMGDWFLDKSTGYESAINKSGVRKVVNSKMEEIQKAVQKIDSNTKEGKTELGNIFVKTRKEIGKLFSNQSELGEEMWKRSVIEGVEEVTEQAAIDMAKGVVDTMSWLGMTKKQGTFGGWSNIFSQEGFQNYISNLVGGMIGGPMFELQARVIEPKLSGKPISKDNEYDLIRLIANGHKNEIMHIIDSDKSSYGSSTLSPIASKIGDKEYYLTTDNASQADVIAAGTKQYVDHIDRMLNLENVGQDDESIIRKTIMDEIIINDMAKNKTDNFILSDFTELASDIVDLRTKIDASKDKTPNPKDVEDLNKKREQVTKMLNGELSEYYHGLSLFTLNKALHGSLINLNVNDYVKQKYNEDFLRLDSDTKKSRQEEFTKIINDGGLKSIKLKYATFIQMVENFSPSISEYDKSGYAAITKDLYKKLRPTTVNDLGQVYTTYNDLINISYNPELTKNGLPKVTIDPNMKVDMGSFLVDVSKVITVDEDNKEIAKAAINNFGIPPVALNTTVLVNMINSINNETDKLIIDGLETLANPEVKEEDKVELRNGIEMLKKSKLKISPNIEENNELQMPLLETILTYTKDTPVITEAIREDLVNYRNFILNKIEENKQNLLMFGSFNSESKLENWLYDNNTSIKNIYDSLTNEEKNELESNAYSIESGELVSGVDPKKIREIDKVLAKENQSNAILEKLKDFQIELYGGNKNLTIFGVLQDNTDMFNRTSITSEFIRNDTQVEQLDRALNTINLIKSVGASMLTTEIGPNNLYGMNVILNKMADRNGKKETYKLIGKESFVSLIDDLNIIENKLKYFKYLSEVNANTEVEQQNRIKVNGTKAIIDQLTNSENIHNIFSLKINGESIIQSKDIEDLDKESDDKQLLILNNLLFKRFHEKAGINIEGALNEIFSSFTNTEELKNILDMGKTTVLTPNIKQLELKDYYKYLYTVFASDSNNFYLYYKNLIEKELSLQENKAPFFGQELALQFMYSYIMNKEIIANSTKMIQPEYNELDLNKLKEELSNGLGIPLPYILKVLGSAGTGKSTVLADFILKLITDNKLKSLDNIEIILSAPNETSLDNMKAIGESTKNTKTLYLKDDLMKKLLGSKYSILNDEWDKLKKDSKNYSGDILIPDPKGVFESTLVSTNKFLNSIPKINHPVVIVIDEVSRYNTIELQVLNHLAKVNKDFYVFGLGDDLQNGEIIDTINPDGTIKKYYQGMDNFIMPSTIKLKSSIRSKNSIQAANNLVLEQLAENIKDIAYRKYTGTTGISVSKDILYYDDGNSIFGDKFINNFNVSELKKLNKNKEIAFITENNSLTDDELNIIHSAFGNDYVPMIFPKDVQSREFDQVVILANFVDSNDFDLIRDLYTLMSRAKETTLIIGNDIQKNKIGIVNKETTINSEKLLNNDQVKRALEKRLEELNELTKDLNVENSTSEPIITTDTINIDEYNPRVIDSIFDNVAEKIKESQSKNDEHSDKKYIAYSFFNNLGTTEDLWNDGNFDEKLDEENEDTRLLNFNNLRVNSNNTQTDLFSLPISDNYIKTNSLRTIIDKYIKYKNSLLFNSFNDIGSPVEIQDFLEIEPRKELTIKKLDKHSLSFGKLVKNDHSVINKPLYTIGMNLTFGVGDEAKTIFISLMALPDPDNNAYIQDIPERKVQYEEFLNRLNSEEKINPSELIKIVKRYTGVIIPKDQTNKKWLDKPISFENLQNNFPGAYINLDSNNNIKVFYAGIDSVDSEGNVTNRYRDIIKKTFEQSGMPKDINLPYEKFYGRPYVEISYTDSKDHKELSRTMVLRAKSRTLQKLEEQVNNLEQEDSEKDEYSYTILLSKYQGWEILSDYIKFLQDQFMNTPAEYKTAINSLKSIFIKQLDYDEWTKSGNNEYAVVDTKAYKELLSTIIDNLVDGKTFGELSKSNPDFRKLITGYKGERTPDPFNNKITNAYFVLHHAKNELNAEGLMWSSDDPKKSTPNFVDNYSKIENGKIINRVYYNSIINKAEGSNGEYGTLKPEFKQYFELAYAVEPPKYFLDLKNLDTLFLKPGVSTKEESIEKYSKNNPKPSFIPQVSEDIENSIKLDNWISQSSDINSVPFNVSVNTINYTIEGVPFNDSVVLNGELIKSFYNEIRKTLPDVTDYSKLNNELTNKITGLFSVISESYENWKAFFMEDDEETLKYNSWDELFNDMFGIRENSIKKYPNMLMINNIIVSVSNGIIENCKLPLGIDPNNIPTNLNCIIN